MHVMAQGTLHANNAALTAAALQKESTLGSSTRCLTRWIVTLSLSQVLQHADATLMV